MSRIVFILVSVLLLGFSQNISAQVRPVGKTTADQIEKTYNSTVPSDEGWQLQRKHLYSVALDSKSPKLSLFGSFIGNEFRFALFSADGKRLEQTLPLPDLAIAQIFSPAKVDAVQFKDVDADGKVDILVVATYFDSRPVQGDGVGGGSTSVGLIFLNRAEKFELRSDCDNVQDMKALKACSLKKKFGVSREGEKPKSETHAFQVRARVQYRCYAGENVAAADSFTKEPCDGKTYEKVVFDEPLEVVIKDEPDPDDSSDLEGSVIRELEFKKRKFTVAMSLFKTAGAEPYRLRIVARDDESVARATAVYVRLKSPKNLNTVEVENSSSGTKEQIIFTTFVGPVVR